MRSAYYDFAVSKLAEIEEKGSPQSDIRDYATLYDFIAHYEAKEMNPAKTMQDVPTRHYVSDLPDYKPPYINSWKNHLEFIRSAFNGGTQQERQEIRLALHRLID